MLKHYVQNAFENRALIATAHWFVFVSGAASLLIALTGSLVS